MTPYFVRNIITGRYISCTTFVMDLTGKPKFYRTNIDVGGGGTGAVFFGRTLVIREVRHG